MHHSSKTHSRRAAAAAVDAPASAPSKQLQNVRQYVEKYVREHPVKAVGQSAAIGYALHLLPLRSLLSFSLRLATPLLCLGALWKACDHLEQK